MLLWERENYLWRELDLSGNDTCLGCCMQVQTSCTSRAVPSMLSMFEYRQDLEISIHHQKYIFHDVLKKAYTKTVWCMLTELSSWPQQRQVDFLRLPPRKQKGQTYARVWTRFCTLPRTRLYRKCFFKDIPRWSITSSVLWCWGNSTRNPTSRLMICVSNTTCLLEFRKMLNSIIFWPIFKLNFIELLLNVKQTKSS